MIAIGVWLFALALVLLTSALLAVQLALGRRSFRIVLAASLVLSAVYCLLGVDAANRLLSMDAGSTLLQRFGVMLLAMAAVAVQLAAARWFDFNRSARPWRMGLASLLLCLCLAAGLSGWRFQGALHGAFAEPLSGALGMEAIPGEGLLTDRGRIVPVFRARIDGLTGYSEYPDGTFDDQRIVQATDDSRSNCHGWVFTGGRYLLKGSGVEMILADNGYGVVHQPRTGDVIVYRDLLGQIVHTGLVKAAFDDGLILIESKWGVEGRYLHRPEGQHYSKSFAYYRKSHPRPGPNPAATHLVQAITLPVGFEAGDEQQSALARQASPPHSSLEPPMVDELGRPVPDGAEYPLGAE